MDSLEIRKERQRRVRLLKIRSKQHAVWALQEGILSSLISYLDDSNPSIRGGAALCMGRIATAFDSEEKLKPLLLDILKGSFSILEEEECQVVELQENQDINDIPGPKGTYTHPPMWICKQRAALTIALFTASPELGVWALEKPGGLPQLMLLISTGDVRFVSGLGLRSILLQS
jgi:hypothetical protein